MTSMLAQLLIFGLPLAWLTLAVVVIGACRAAGRADAVSGSRGGAIRLGDRPQS
jgi:hypothetical protein